MERLPPHRERPESSSAFRRKSRHSWLIPLLWPDWSCRYFAFYLSRWAFLEVLEYLGSLSILFAVILYFTEAGERREQKHYQAWQVINTAQDKGGNGGRIDALQELNADNISLVGVDVRDAFLQNIELDKAKLARATFHSADIREGHFRQADLEGTDLVWANLRGSDLRLADLSGANLLNADLTGADLREAKVGGVDFEGADLRDTDINGLMDWRSIESIHLANIHHIKNTPAGFTQWAIQNGAVDMASTDQWNAALHAAGVDMKQSK